MDCDKLLTLGTEMGRLLMTSGAEIYRVEESMSRLLVAYGMDPQVFAIPSCIIVSITTPQGQPITRMVRIPAHGTDIELLERCNQLCRQLCAHPLPVDKALKLVSGLTQSRTYSTGGLLLSYPVAAAFFGMFFGGDLMDGVGAFLCGLAIGLFLLFGQRITGSNAFLRTAICAAVAAARAMALVPIGLGHRVESVTIGGLMVLVPGVALTNAMREIMAGDIISGVNRTAEAFLIASSIALGAAAPMVISRMF